MTSDHEAQIRRLADAAAKKIHALNPLCPRAHGKNHPDCDKQDRIVGEIIARALMSCTKELRDQVKAFEAADKLFAANFDESGDPRDAEVQVQRELAAAAEAALLDARNLCAEVAQGVTHSPDCEAPRLPCCRCKWEAAEARERALVAAIRDADAHATPYGETAYLVTLGAWHRLLGTNGGGLTGACEHKAEAQRLREALERIVYQFEQCQQGKPAQSALRSVVIGAEQLLKGIHF